MTRALLIGVWAGFWSAAAMFFGVVALGFATIGRFCQAVADMPEDQS